MSEPYVYPGFKPFADKAAEDYKIPEADRHRVGSGPFVRDIESGLSQLPGQADRERRMLNPEGSTQDAINRIKATREILAAQLGAVDLAIHEVFGELGLRKELSLDDILGVDDEPKTKPKPKPKTALKAKD